MNKEKYLTGLGFNRKYTFLKQSYWLEKHVKNKYFKRLCISYDFVHNTISVWCKQIGTSYDHIIIETNFTKKKVKEILIMFDENYLFK